MAPWVGLCCLIRYFSGSTCGAATPSRLSPGLRSAGTGMFGFVGRVFHVFLLRWLRANPCYLASSSICHRFLQYLPLLAGVLIFPVVLLPRNALSVVTSSCRTQSHASTWRKPCFAARTSYIGLVVGGPVTLANVLVLRERSWEDRSEAYDREGVTVRELVTDG